METFNINTVLGIALGYLIGQLVRWARRKVFWRRVEKTAKSYIDSPDVPIDDAKIATQEALLNMHEPSVEMITRSIRKSIPPATVPLKRDSDSDVTPKLNKGEK